jgi:hypothetical protein
VALFVENQKSEEDKIKIAIANFLIAYNQLEWSINFLIMAMAGDEDSVQLAIAGFDFERRKQYISDLIDIYKGEYEKENIEKVWNSDFLDNIGNVQKFRNKLVHGMVLSGKSGVRIKDFYKAKLMKDKIKLLEPKEISTATLNMSGSDLDMETLFANVLQTVDAHNKLTALSQAIIAAERSAECRLDFDDTTTE